MSAEVSKRTGQFVDPHDNLVGLLLSDLFIHRINSKNRLHDYIVFNPLPGMKCQSIATSPSGQLMSFRGNRPAKFSTDLWTTLPS